MISGFINFGLLYIIFFTIRQYNHAVIDPAILTYIDSCLTVYKLFESDIKITL